MCASKKPVPRITLDAAHAPRDARIDSSFAPRTPPASPPTAAARVSPRRASPARRTPRADASSHRLELFGLDTHPRFHLMGRNATGFYGRDILSTTIKVQCNAHHSDTGRGSSSIAEGALPYDVAPRGRGRVKKHRPSNARRVIRDARARRFRIKKKKHLSGLEGGLVASAMTLTIKKVPTVVSIHQLDQLDDDAAACETDPKANLVSRVCGELDAAHAELRAQTRRDQGDEEGSLFRVARRSARPRLGV